MRTSARFRTFVGVVAAVLLGGAVAGGATAPAGAQPAPTVSASPATGLVAGQVVQLSGTGFPADATLYLGQCPPGVVDDPFACDGSTLVNATTDHAGAFSTEFRVFRFIMGGAVDCAAGGCTLGATNLGLAMAATPTTFVDEPVDEQVSATPTTDLVEGQHVTVSGTGFTPDTSFSLRQCPPGATSFTDCSTTGETSARTDDTGAFEATFTARRFISASGLGTIDCSVVACSIGVRVRGLAHFIPVSFSDAPPPTGSITVTPSTDLLRDQRVQVTGTGFAPNTTVLLSSCLSGATRPSLGECSLPSNKHAQVDASGSFTTELRVERVFTGDDCVEVACAVVAFAPDSMPLDVEAPVHFADVPLTPPTIGVSSAHLVDGDTVLVTGSGVHPNTALLLLQCPTAPKSFDDCRSSGFGTSGGGGTITHSTLVQRVLRPFGGGPDLDCAVEVCTIGILEGGAVWTSPPLEFADPELAIDISPIATLRAGTNEVVAQLTVSCDVPTPVAVRTTVSQPGIEGVHVLDSQRCGPDRPLRVFVPTRQFPVEDADFSLGAATLSASASATRTYTADDPATVFTEAAGTIQLLDLDEVAAIIGGLLADPANVELREQVFADIQLRLDQDPVFRAEWQAAVRG